MKVTWKTPVGCDASGNESVKEPVEFRKFELVAEIDGKQYAERAILHRHWDFDGLPLGSSWRHQMYRSIGMRIAEEVEAADKAQAIAAEELRREESLPTLPKDGPIEKQW